MTSNNEDLYRSIGAVTDWLDTSNLNTPHEDSMRVLKLVEEAGEAAAAYIGMVGQNPRKGVTHTREQFLDELADVAITALCAIQHFTGNEAETSMTVSRKLVAMLDRIGIVLEAQEKE